MYFDPGMGSLIIQVIVAGLAVVGGYFAVVKTKIKDIFNKKKEDPEEMASEDGENEFEETL